MSDNVEVTDFAEQWKKTLKNRFRQELAQLAVEFPHNKSLYVDVRKVLDRELFNQLLQAPTKAMGHIRDAIRWNHLIRLEEEDYEEIQVRFIHLPRKTPIRDIRADNIGELIAVDGVIRRVSEVKPKLKVALYRCRSCGTLIRVRQSLTAVKLEPPVQCTNCDKVSTRSFSLVERGHEFVNCQVVTLQEPHETMGVGESPQSIEVMLFDDIAGHLNAGNRITLNGILWSVPQSRDNPMFDIFFEGVSFEKDQKDPDTVSLTDREFEVVQRLAADPTVYGQLVNSIAPTIYGNDVVKLAIVLQLFGGVRKEFGSAALRGDIHILMIGDPSVAKSQLLTSAVRLSGRGVITSGKSATAAGLTAAATKDDSRLGGGKWVLEAGALVLADGGLAGVDELDKMSENDRSAIHHALEQQTIPLSKAGISTVLRSRCSLLAAANPKLGRFDDCQPLADQFNLEPTLLSRFDLIFVLLDTPAPERDARIAAHILKTHQRGGQVQAHLAKEEEIGICPTVPQDLMKKYIAYARRTCIPVLTDEAKEVLEKYYLGLRGKARDGATVPATARQLEALVRLSEASAKVRLSSTVTKEDAELVTALVTECLQQVAYDKFTGMIDIDRMSGRTSKSQRDRVAVLTAIIREVADHDTGIAQTSVVVAQAMSRNLSDAEIQDGMEVMRRNCLILEPRKGMVKLL